MPRRNAAHSRLVNEIMLALSPLGVRLWKNNQGVAVYPGGVHVPYGLCHPGGSDLIGFVPRDGAAVFLAIEVKTGTARATTEQRQFIEAVLAAGGIAGVVRSVEEAVGLVGARVRVTIPPPRSSCPAEASAEPAPSPSRQRRSSPRTA